MSVNWDVNWVLIEGIDWNSTVVNLSTHDLKEIMFNQTNPCVRNYYLEDFLVYWNRIWDKQIIKNIVVLDGEYYYLFSINYVINVIMLYFYSLLSLSLSLLL